MDALENMKTAKEVVDIPINTLRQVIAIGTSLSIVKVIILKKLSKNKMRFKRQKRIKGASKLLFFINNVFHHLFNKTIKIMKPMIIFFNS